MSTAYYELTPAQKAQYQKIREYHTQQVANICVSMSLQAPLDFGLLKKCIQLEYERYECLRIRFTAPDQEGNIRQFISPKEHRDIRHVNLAGGSNEDAYRIMHGWSETPFEGDDVPLNEFIMITLPEGYNGIYLKIDHRLADSCAVTVMVNDIMELYCHYRFGTPYPDALSSYTEMLEKDLQRSCNEKRRAKDAAYWESTFDTYGEPMYSDITGSKVLEESRKKHGSASLRAADREMEHNEIDRAIYKLDPYATQNLLDFCMNHQTSMTNLLLLGMRTYLSKMCDGQEDITIRNYISRRSTHAEWTSGGNRTIAYPCRTVIDPDTTFAEALLEIQATQNHVYRHANYDPALLAKQMKDRYPVPANTTYESVGLTYQPLPIRLKNQALSGISIRNQWIPNGSASQKVYLTVMHNTEDTGLGFYFRYQTAHLTPHDIELFYYYLMRILFKGIAEPDMTIGEIIAAV